jgi:2-polyprenyl-3-methyl-5-hydroxy-6-metoxy-1,4-benzoquinol methylase
MTSATFWDKIADRYATQPIGNMAAYEATLDRVRHWLGPDMSVLEIGCGTGSTALLLAEGVARYLGTDLSGEMVRIANDKATGRPNLSFERAPAETVDASGQQFDAVLAFNLLHLVEDRGAVMAHIRNSVPEGGLFLSKTPCLSGKPWLHPLIWAMQLVGKAPKPVHFVSPAQLEAEITAAGFEVLETGGYPQRLPNHLVAARAV